MVPTAVQIAGKLDLFARILHCIAMKVSSPLFKHIHSYEIVSQQDMNLTLQVSVSGAAFLTGDSEGVVRLWRVQGEVVTSACVQVDTSKQVRG